MDSNPSANGSPSPPSYVETVSSNGPPLVKDRNVENRDILPQLQPQLQPQPQLQTYVQIPSRPQLQSQPQAGPTYIVTIQPQMQSPVYCGNLGDHPCPTTCTNCHQRITARVTYKPGIFSWVICVVFVIFGLICGCCLIPFFVESFQDAHHSCPLCSAHLHVHKKM